jgi:hypothetical protein
MSITNVHGDVVWDNCYVGDRPGACAMFLMLHSIASNGVYTIDKTWNQRSGSSHGFVARGTYTLTSSVSGVTAIHKVEFELIQ